jgi:hypothetical protein
MSPSKKDRNCFLRRPTRNTIGARAREEAALLGATAVPEICPIQQRWCRNRHLCGERFAYAKSLTERLYKSPNSHRVQALVKLLKL